MARAVLPECGRLVLELAEQRFHLVLASREEERVEKGVPDTLVNHRERQGSSRGPGGYPHREGSGMASPGNSDGEKVSSPARPAERRYCPSLNS